MSTWPTKYDSRGAGAERTITGEVHVIGEDIANYVLLQEVPLQESPSTVTLSVSGTPWAEVTTAPGPGQFEVVYSGRLMGGIIFNALDAGKTVTVGYKGRGSNAFARDINKLQTLKYDADGSMPMLGPVTVPSGTVALPSLTFTGDTATGFYRTGAGAIGVSANGTQVGVWSSTGLAVTGVVAATTLSGDGSALTNLSAGNIATGTVPSARVTGSYTGVTGLGTLTVGVWNATPVSNAYIAAGLDVAKLTVGSTLPSNIVSSSLSSVGTLTAVTVSGTATLGVVTATSLNVSAAGLPVTFNNTSAAGINAIIAGQRAGATLWSLGLTAGDIFALLNAAGDTANVTVTNAGAMTVRAGVTATTANFTGLITGGAGASVTGNVSATTFTGDGSSVTNLNATAIATGTLADSHLSANVPLLNTSNTFSANQAVTVTWNNGATVFSGWTITVTDTASDPASMFVNYKLGAVSKFSVSKAGVVTAVAHVGDGSALTNLAAGNLATGTVPSAVVTGSYTGITGVGTITVGVWNGTQIVDTYIASMDASKLLGTVVSARLSGTYSINVTGNAGTVTNGVVTTGSYADPAWITSLAGSKISGNITGSASNITSYTINQSLGTANSPTFAGLTVGGYAAVTNNTGTWSISITGNAATLSNFSVGARSSADANTYLTSGTAAFNGTPTNAPASYGVMFVATNSDVGMQISGGYQSDNMYFRGWYSSGASFTSWRTVLHNGNYNSYAPTLTGGGASGTWGINITGNAATAYGLNVQSAGSAPGANNVLRADGSGYTFHSYINSSSPNSESASGSIAQIVTTNGSDGYYRKATIAALTSAVQSNAGGTWGINISGNAATATSATSATSASNATTTSQRTFGNVRTDGINRGSYGSVSISGNTGGYSGIDFTDYSMTLMVSTGATGFFKNNNTWLVYWDTNGVMQAGTVPGGSVSGTVANATNATNATNSTNATYATYINNDSYNMKLHYSSQGGQPTYLWGTNNGQDAYIWNPSNFSVNYATTAGTASNISAYTINQSVGTGNAVTFSTVTASAFYTSSSRAVKTNITPFTDLFKESALDIVNSVTVVGFNYIADAEKNQKVGFIAEDTHELLSGRARGIMDTANSIGVLLKAVQELSSENTRLKGRLSDLERKVA